ncbi:MAG: Trk family potassium uptake protein [Tissierellia bacterium]|nr:Trk family potassium uptake protein [Tissierellia bacterium]
MQIPAIRHWQKNPPLVLAVGFLFMIAVGTLLLMHPVSSAAGVGTTFMDAFFTATSATCVTGLAVVNTAVYWSVFGQAVILVLIQIGGLGFMTMTVLIAMLLHKKITLSDRLVIKEQFGQESLTGMVRWMRYIMLATLGVEMLGAVFLSTQWIPLYGWKTGLWYSVFHAVSAFCNAGFDLFGDSLLPFQANSVVQLTIAALIIAGGLGFSVHMDLFRRNRKRWQLHTKLVLSMTMFLLAGGTLLFFLIESKNPATWATLPVWERWQAAFFQSVTTRTAGFYSVSQSNLTEISLVLSIFLMFIGGSPAGTAGGIKTTTFAVLLLSTRAQIQGASHIEVFKRSIHSDVVMRALTMIMIALVWVISISFILAVKENIPYLQSIYETVSAFATVGLTMDLTPRLSTLSKVLLAITMYAGRVGPVTLAYALIQRKKKADYRSAEGNVMVG